MRVLLADVGEEIDDAKRDTFYADVLRDEWYSPYIARFIEMKFSPVLDTTTTKRVKGKKIKVTIIQPNNKILTSAVLTLLKEGLKRLGRNATMSLDDTL